MKLNKSLKIGITGSRGFIGSHIAKALDKKGAKLSFFDKPKNNLLESNLVALKKFVLNNDIIIHTAAINRGSDTEVIAGSVVATYNLISAMEKYGSKAKLIFLSSIQAETETLYGKSKLLAEIMLEDFSKRNKIPVSVFRLINIFGEGGKPFYNSVIVTFCYQTAKGEKLNVNSDNKKFKFFYVGDLVEIIIKELTAKRKNNFYLKTISSSNEITIPELAEIISGFNIGKLKPKSKFEKDLYKTYLSYRHKLV